MRRVPTQARPDWRARVEGAGLLYHTVGETPYWFEGAYYAFTEAQVDQVLAATGELHAMCLEAVDHVVRHGLYARLGIPDLGGELIERSWKRHDPHLYGRFDLAYDGLSAPKLLEYNADTPTALLEAAVIQWQWLEERFPEEDQFNSIWEGLIERWRELAPEKVMFSCVDSLEDEMTVTLLMDAALEAGVVADFLAMEDIGWNGTLGQFVDLEEKPITNLFKLYPWEGMLQEAFAEVLVPGEGHTRWIEPIWKLVLSSKGILAILWELFPNHPNLLEAHLGSPEEMTSYVRKPIFGREGANVKVVDGWTLEETEGEYGTEGYVFQRYCPLPDFEGNHPLVGSWVIGNEARGMGIRESDGLITTNLSRFVPHLFTE